MFRKVSTILALLASASVSAAAQIEFSAIAPASYTVQGRVVTPTGLPIADAIVSVVIAGSTEPIVSTRTNADGAYVLTVPSASCSYALRVISMGFTPVTLPETHPDSTLAVPSEIIMHSFRTDDGSATWAQEQSGQGLIESLGLWHLKL